MPSNLLDFYNIDKDLLSLRSVLAHAQHECHFQLAKDKFDQLTRLAFEQIQEQRKSLSIFESNIELHSIFSQSCNKHPLGEDFFPLLNFLGKGKFFSLNELNLFAKFCELINTLRKDKQLKNFLSPDLNIEPIKQNFLIPLRLLIDAEGREHFSNHPLLKPILNEIEVLDVKIRETIKRVMNSNDFKERLDTNQFDIIKGRFVLCINTFKYAISLGSITDRSSSGNILYIEPREIRQVNNQRENLYLDFLEKLDTIIFELSTQVNFFSSFIFNLSDNLIRLDYLQALSKFHFKYNLQPPKLENNTKILTLHSIFHPGISNCIKNDFVFSQKDYSSFCLSGTNTGGKTAFLKSIAINILFAHWGLNVPASSAEIPIFDSVYFINSENEDLDNGLSSFSGEVSELLDILSAPRGRTLVIVDEIFNSTSSDEASTLAYALLMFAKQQPSLNFLISTHHEELKRKLSTKPDVLSAHVEFNRQDLKPTYKVILGRPGSSEAINIFQSICTKLNFDHNKILSLRDNELPTKNEYEIQNLDKLAFQYEEKLIELENQESALKAREKKLNEMKSTFIEQEITAFKEWLGEEREVFQNEVKLKKSKIAIEDLTLKTKMKIDASPVAQEILFNIGENKQTQNNISPKEQLILGKLYFSPLLKGNVRIEQYSKAKNQYLVNFNNKKLWLPTSQIKSDSKVTIEPVKSYASISLTTEARLSIDLRGYRLEEFENEVKKCLSELPLNQTPFLEVIHGHGDGKLKSWLRTYLAKNKDRYKYEISEFNDGSTTIFLID